MTTYDETTARLLISCPDAPGIVAAASGFLYAHGVNITELDQHSSEREGGTFFMRMEFQTPHLDLSRPALERSFAEVVAARFGMTWRLTYAAEKKKMVLFVSKADHALMELLWRWSRGELPSTLAMVISNHPNLRPAVEAFGIPYHHVPFTPATRPEAERKILELLDGHDDVLVLARFMQVLSPEFVDRYPARIINIHHSFLPAFAGANPYGQAYDRGVKRIGATAHYVTNELDEGPIIEQDVITVSHKQSRDELQALGQDIERQVLARAVKWHLEDRVLLHGNRTVVFV